MPTNSVEAVLAAFPWLAKLGNEVYNVLVQGVLNNDPIDVMVQAVRNTATYKRRFAGMQTRIDAGFPAISEAQYLDIEAGYYTQLRDFNLLGTLGLNTEEAFRNWAAQKIGDDVSVSELNRRLDYAEALANDSSDMLQQTFQEWYGTGVSHNALVTYFLDADRGTAEIENQLAAATIGSEALSRGLNITRTRAEILRREGVTADLARQGFADIAREEPVLKRLAQIQQVTPLSQGQLEEFFFHEDPTVAERRNRVFTQALAQFQSVGGTPGLTRQGGLSELVDPNRTV